MKQLKWLVVLLVLFSVITSCCFGDDELASKKNEVEESFATHAEENGYEAFVNYMERELEEDEFKELLNVLDGSYIKNGMHTLKYSSVSGSKEYCFMHGKYSIPYNVRLVVDWAANIEIDTYNDNFKCNRHYTVSDPNKVAYMLISGYENGYKLIRIVPDDSEEMAEIDYTEDGFYYLYNFLHNKEQIWMTAVFNDFKVSEELVANLKNSEKDYLLIFDYAKNILGETGKNIQSKIESGKMTDGIETIAKNAVFESEYYMYKDETFSVMKQDFCSVCGYQNFIEIVDEETSEIRYTIDNPEEDAFILILTEQGFSIVHITKEI